MGFLLEPSGHTVPEMRERKGGVLRPVLFLSGTSAQGAQEGEMHCVPVHLEAEQEAKIIFQGRKAFFLNGTCCILMGDNEIKDFLSRNLVSGGEVV
jgi:hypothetical protein